VNAQRLQLRGILEPEMRNEGFFWDQDGQLKYALYLSFLGNYFYERRMIGESVLMFGLSSTVDPSYYGSISMQGMIHATLNREKDAEELLLRAIRMAPYRAEARNNLARLYMNQGRFKEAVSEIREVLRYHPRHPFAHLSLGLCYRELGEEEQFLHQMRTLLVLDATGEEGAEAARHLREFQRAKRVEKAAGTALK